MTQSVEILIRRDDLNLSGSKKLMMRCIILNSYIPIFPGSGTSGEVDPRFEPGPSKQGNVFLKKWQYAIQIHRKKVY